MYLVGSYGRVRIYFVQTVLISVTVCREGIPVVGPGNRGVIGGANSNIR